MNEVYIIDPGGKIETTAHYFLQCPNYRNTWYYRCTVFNIWQQLKNENENKMVFETVSMYMYISRTERFDWTKMGKGIDQTAHELYIMGCS